MTDHHPLQMELAIKVAAADVAAKRLAELQARRREIETRAHELTNAAAVARTALREAAGASAAGEGDATTVARARKAVVSADSDAELASLELEGIASRVTHAEREHAAKRRDLGLAGVDVIRIAVADLEAEARATFTRFAQIMRSRGSLAKLASSLATEATGHASEPIAWSSPTSGLLRRDNFDEGFAGVLKAHGLTELFSPTSNVPRASVADLLELTLPAQAKAAE